MMTIRDRWYMQSEEFNQFDSLGVDEVEKFADEQIEALEAELEALRLDCVGTMIGQRELYLTKENAVLVKMVQGMQAELAALKCCGNCEHCATRLLYADQDYNIDVCTVDFGKEDTPYISPSHRCDRWEKRK